jgi:hypothetical protein
MLETIQEARRSVAWTSAHYLNGDHPETETIPNKRANSTAFCEPLDFCATLGSTTLVFQEISVSRMISALSDAWL